SAAPAPAWPRTPACPLRPRRTSPRWRSPAPRTPARAGTAAPRGAGSPGPASSGRSSFDPPATSVGPGLRAQPRTFAASRPTAAHHSARRTTRATAPPVAGVAVALVVTSGAERGAAALLAAALPAGAVRDDAGHDQHDPVDGGAAGPQIGDEMVDDVLAELAQPLHEHALVLGDQLHRLLVEDDERDAGEPPAGADDVRADRRPAGRQQQEAQAEHAGRELDRCRDVERAAVDQVEVEALAAVGHEVPADRHEHDRDQQAPPVRGGARAR